MGSFNIPTDLLDNSSIASTHQPMSSTPEMTSRPNYSINIELDGVTKLEVIN